MNPIPALDYPTSEHVKLVAIHSLLDDWDACFATLPTGSLASSFGGIVRDGFYPYYFQQRLRILFIGREALGLDGCDYLEVLAHSYRTTKKVGKQHLNASKFHARMLYLAHGLQHGMQEWSSIPWASQIGDSFATNDGVSFAFMNLSKVSNEADYWASDWGSIRSASKASLQSRNFSREEIEILEPDVIITMNIAGQIKEAIGDLTRFYATTEADGYSVIIGGKPTLLIDTWHFSAPGKSNHVKYFYAPVCEIIKAWYEDSGSALNL